MGSNASVEDVQRGIVPMLMTITTKTFSENTKPFRNVLVAGFILNLVLDPWFIFGGFGLPAMGITGIAIATVLVKILGCIYLAVYNVKVGTLSLQSFQTYSVPRLQAIRDINSPVASWIALAGPTKTAFAYSRTRN